MRVRRDPLDESDSDALFAATRCEESTFPWDRNAGAEQRASQALAAARAHPATDFQPFNYRIALRSESVPVCLAWPNASPPPAPPAPLPPVPTLILSGASDLRTPFEDAAGVAARIPGAQLVAVPFTGHSVVTSDLSDCAKNAIAAFFAGQPAAQCPAAQQVIAPSPISPTRLSKLPGRTTVTKTIAAVTATVRDVKLQFLGDEIAAGRATPVGSKVAGLRSGHATATSHGYNLRRVEFVPGVTVNGTVPAQKGSSTLDDQRPLGAPRQADHAPRRHRHRPPRRAQGVGARRPRGARGDAAAAREAAPLSPPPTVGLMPNALAHETSPYLLQHRDNPVDWLPWGDEALRRARELDRPLIVSIGYSSCHWCHVMERESFEDPETAALMNERFVCVKVDREERPDVDALYMDAVQAMTGHGGWPLNVFLTPEQAPFYGGTYFPPEARQGMPSWRQVLGAVADAWDTQREDIRAQGEQVAPRLAGGALLAPSEQPLDGVALDDAVATLRTSFDSVHGGWGRAPKFPQASVIEFLLARDEQPMALQTLRSMAGGGIFDQVGGGFSRYSVDARWTVPHFEKMLYDNALLARAYLHGFQASGDALLRRTAEETLDWALREMRAPEGGFYSALDADSEGVEGKFYVWSVDELRAALGDDAEAAIAWFGATDARQLRGRQHPRVARARAAAGAARADPRDPAGRRAPSACARASTTSAWPPGTR